jgi:preprotein translocase subunit YajC
MFDIDLDILTLAQDGSAGQPGTVTGESGSTSGNGGTGGTSGGGATSGSPFNPTFLFLMLGLLVLMIVFSTMGPRREKKRREAMLSTIAKHDRVQTVGGVIGSIVEVKPDSVVLKVDESSNTRITFAKSAIQQVLSSAGGSSPDDS